MDYPNCKLCPKSLCNGSQSGIDKTMYVGVAKLLGYRLMFPCYSDPTLKKIEFTATVSAVDEKVSFFTSDNFNDCVDFIINNANLELEDTLELLKYKNEMTENVCLS